MGQCVGPRGRRCPAGARPGRCEGIWDGGTRLWQPVGAGARAVGPQPVWVDGRPVRLQKGVPRGPPRRLEAAPGSNSHQSTRGAAEIVADMLERCWGITFKKRGFAFGGVKRGVEVLMHPSGCLGPRAKQASARLPLSALFWRRAEAKRRTCFSEQNGSFSGCYRSWDTGARLRGCAPKKMWLRSRSGRRRRLPASPDLSCALGSSWRWL